MTATVVERPAAPAAAAPGDPRRAMLALARVEAVRLLRHPVLIVGSLLFLAPDVYRWLTGGANRYPVLHEQDWRTQFLTMLVLGGAALVAANLAALRARRHGTAVLYDVLVLPDRWRVGAFLLAVAPAGLVAAGLIGVRIGVLAALPGAAGRPNPFELAVGPVVVVLLGAVGVLLARLVRLMIVAPLALLVLLVVTFASMLDTVPGASRLRWLLPVAVEDPPMPLPADLVSRPAGRHLAYVVGLVILVAVAALATAGARRRRIVPAGTAVGLAAGLAVTVLAGSAQLLPVSDAVRIGRVTAVERPHELHTCRSVQQVTYCAFDGFTPWIDGWDAVVRGVLRRVPAADASRPLAVRQRLITVHSGGRVVSADEQAAEVAAWARADAAAGTPNAVTVTTHWGTGPVEAGFAGLVAYEVVTRAGTPSGGSLCGARGVLVGWLAGQATPETAAGLRELDAISWGAVPFGEPVMPSTISVPDREMAVAFAVLARPADEVAEVVRRSWAELSAADTPAERAGELFGVPVPPLPPEEERTTCTA